MKTLKLITTVALVALMGACSKEPGFGGKKEINGTVTYTGGSAANAIVYLKFDASETTESFDYSTTTDASGIYRFEGLQKGDYFIDATYTDANGMTFNTAGYHVLIDKKKGEVVVDIALN